MPEGALTFTPERVRSLVEAPLVLVKSSLVKASLILVKASLILTIWHVVVSKQTKQLCVDLFFPRLSLLSSARVRVVAVVVAAASTAKESPEELLVRIFL